MYMKLILFLMFVLMIAYACNQTPEKQDQNYTNLPAPTSLQYSIIKVYNHDQDAFTQGLQFYKGVLFEGTGNPDNLPGKSRLRKVDIESGKVLQDVPLPGQLFGEGITILNNKIYQLTWQDHKGFIYDLETMKLLKEFPYRIEGWGLTNDGTHLIVSDGSNSIYFWDPETFKEIKRISVQDHTGLRNNINELEYVNGFIYANVWGADEILKIDAATGNVIAYLDLSELKKMYPELKGAQNENVLNGIAWDSTGNRFFITGKKWSKLFEIKIQ